MSEYNIYRIKSVELFSFVDEIFVNNSSFCITVIGDSMYPFLRDGVDKVVLAKAISPLKSGDIVLILRESAEYVLHRIIKKNIDGIYIVGDAQLQIEGPIKHEQIIAVVNAVYRKDKYIECNNNVWKFLSLSWLLILPFRRYIISFYSYIRKAELRCRAFLKSIG